MKVILLDPGERDALADEFAAAADRGQSVRVAVDEGSFKIKIGYGSWSPPLGVVEIDDGEPGDLP